MAWCQVLGIKACQGLLRLVEAYMHQWIGSMLFQVMTSCLFGAKPSPKPMLTYCQWELQWNFEVLYISFKKMQLKMLPANCQPFCSGLILSLLLLKLEYSGRTGPIPWLLMAWLLVSPGHQQPWYWPCTINMFLSVRRKNFNNLCHLSFEKQ